MTQSHGVNVSGTVGMWSFNYQIGISSDTKGNIALQHSFSGGLNVNPPKAKQGFSASLSLYDNISNAEMVDNLNGPGCQLGGSIAKNIEGIPLYLGGDFNLYIDENTDEVNAFGLTVNRGIGVPGSEGHVEWGKTWTIGDFNVFDVGKGIYTKIMEW